MELKYNQAVSKSFAPQLVVPQGSIISPIVFIMFANKPNYEETSISQYADDIALYYTYEKQKIATKHLQIGIKHKKRWRDKQEILLNAEKTIYNIITRQILITNKMLGLESEEFDVRKEA